MICKTTAPEFNDLHFPPYSFSATHIGRLGAIGRIFGLATADPAKARVLELGCGTGSNIMAMAQLFPEGEFIGIDASSKQIDLGLEVINSVGINNARLIAADFSQYTEELGKFDYIIVHGVYSYVLDSVKDAILSIASKNLNPGGITYISYNCLPGWGMRSALREMMLMHTSGIPDLLGRVAQAKALVKFLAESCDPETPYGKYLALELELIAKADDASIAKEFLQAESDAVYFTDFLTAASNHNLIYLGDADVASMLVDNLPIQAANTIKSLGMNILATEQYMDFLRNRMFRNTLLCQASSTLNRSIDPSRLKDLHITSLINLKQPQNADQPSVFVTMNGSELTANDDITATIFEAVARIDRKTQSVNALIDQIAPALVKLEKTKTCDSLHESAALALINFYFNKLIDFSLGPISRTNTDSQNPTTLPLARWQASKGQPISSDRLEMLTADQFVSMLITLCDGSRDREQIIHSIIAAVEKNEFTLHENNEPITDPKRLKSIVSQLYDGSITSLSRLGLLIKGQ
jgi:methyltransferase-like protein/SAM-dependent methyltransferase